MGNTVLAHILFASEQVTLNLENFFSESGNAHQIAKLNTTLLSAKHLVEYPDDLCQCALQLVSVDWFDILRIKMSYDKYFKNYPNLKNYSKFFKSVSSPKKDILWQDYYQQVKDPTWPECKSFDNVKDLPAYIKKEIQDNYVEPMFNITNNALLLEFLVYTYYDQLTTQYVPAFDAEIYYIEQYINNDIDSLKKIANKLNWHWNTLLSNQFHNKMLETNSKYFAWIDKIKKNYLLTIDNRPLEDTFKIWEMAIILAKVCADSNLDIKTLQWKNCSCILENNPVQLYKLKEGS